MRTYHPDPATKRSRDRSAEYAKRNESRNTGMPAGRPPRPTGAFAVLQKLRDAECVHLHHETGEPFVLIARQDGTAYPILLSSLVGITIGAVNYLLVEDTATENKERARQLDNNARLESALRIMGGR